MNFLRYTTSDFGLTVSAFAAMAFAWFGDGEISATIALLIVLNLLGYTK
jgi:hypothetical protein